MDHLKRDVMLTVGWISPGEVMEKAYADMSLPDLVSLVCGEEATTRVQLALIAVLLARAITVT